VALRRAVAGAVGGGEDRDVVVRPQMGDDIVALGLVAADRDRGKQVVDDQDAQSAAL